MKRLFQALAHAADAALVIDKDQRIIFWNRAAEELLGYPRHEVMGQPCYEILYGRNDECLICRENCRVATNAFAGKPVINYDARVQTQAGPQRWVNISTFTYQSPANGVAPVLVHLFRDARQTKLNQQFAHRVLQVVQQLQEGKVASPASAPPADPVASHLTRRERQVLSHLAQGSGTADIAQSLSISPATVRNHIRNILQKLDTHSRVEAVIYAIEVGLVDRI